ncbi:MAG: hypothetical protein Fur0039_16500 [Rhodocyclaceae bacterium]
MTREYAPIRSHAIEADATYQQPVLPVPRRVREDDPAVEVMTDFRRVRVVTVPPHVTMEYAYMRMKYNGVRLLPVVDEQNRVLGLITSTDVEGEAPLRIIHDRGIRRGEILVSDIMTPRSRIEVIDIADVERARVGDVVATFKASGRRHAMVVDRDEQGRQCVRGLFSATQVGRQLGVEIQTSEIARSFAQVGSALGH